MLDFSKEQQLYKPVRRYFKNRSYSIQSIEVGFYEHSIDLFALSKSKKETIAVELKLKNWRKALQQTLIYQLCSDFVCVAMPKENIKQEAINEFSKFGIGVIAIYPSGYCRSLLEPFKSSVVRKKYRSRFIGLYGELF